LDEARKRVAAYPVRQILSAITRYSVEDPPKRLSALDDYLRAYPYPPSVTRQQRLRDLDVIRGG